MQEIVLIYCNWKLTDPSNYESDTRTDLHTNGKGSWFMLIKLGKEALGNAISTDLPDGYRLAQFFWVLEVVRSPVAKDVYFM
jgi:hypothetical protein